MALRFSQTPPHLRVATFASTFRRFGSTNLSSTLPVQPRCSSSSSFSETLNSPHHQKLIVEVKERLEREHSGLPLGPNGRDDEEMIRWFLRDRKFSVDEAVAKLNKAIKWRKEFGVSELTEESVRELYGTRKAYVHDFQDTSGRPVLVVVASKHFPALLFIQKRRCSNLEQGDDSDGDGEPNEVQRPLKITVFKFGYVAMAASTKDRMTLAGYYRYCSIFEDLEKGSSSLLDVTTMKEKEKVTPANELKVEALIQSGGEVPGMNGAI